MRELIQRLVETEAEAKAIVEGARVEAARLIEAAKNEAQGLTAAARRDAGDKAEAIIHAAMEEALLEKQQRLAQAKADIESRVRLDDSTKGRLINAVVRCVGHGPQAIQPART